MKLGKRANFPAILTSVIQESIDKFKKLDACDCFKDVPDQEFHDFYREAFDRLIALHFDNLPADDEHKQLVREFCVAVLKSDHYSDFVTGIVFAGFGEHEDFPSLVAYQTDGILLGKLKLKQTDYLVTSRSKIAGEVIPFAQREMVDRFLYGVDPEFEQGIEQFLEGTITEAGEMMLKSAPRTSKETKAKLKNGIDAALAVALKAWREKMVPAVKQQFMQEVQDMIFLMPKQEMATLAQELINLTSVKRKFSTGKETVGGPIDVAVISRIDGFVWVQRKHYFRPELNPRYFVRKFNAPHA